MLVFLRTLKRGLSSLLRLITENEQEYEFRDKNFVEMKILKEKANRLLVINTTDNTAKGFRNNKFSQK